MNKIDVAQRAFKRSLAPALEAAEKSGSRVGVHVAPWLRQYVVPIAASMWQRPRFQEHAGWCRQHLAAGAATPVRSKVEAVDAALVSEAKALLRLAEKVDAAPEDQLISRPVRETADCGGRGCALLKSERLEVIDEWALHQAQVKSLAAHCWTDLVSPWDYFGPHGGLTGRPVIEAAATKRKRRGHSGNANAEGAGAQYSALVPHFNHDLLPAGDLVTRCMLVRIDEFVGMLHAFRGRVQKAYQKAPGSRSRTNQTEQETWNKLRACVDELRLKCIQGLDLQRRDAAVALAQVYLAFGTYDPASIQWLGMPAAMIKSEASYFRSTLEGRPTPQTLDLIAQALRDVEGLENAYPPVNSAFELAVAAGDLVLSLEPRQMYWDGKVVAVNWYDHTDVWEFWHKTAGKTLAGSSIRDLDLYCGPTSVNTMYSRKARAAAVIKVAALTPSASLYQRLRENRW